ncbi:MAG: TAT-variant-translocated molybdopterin oxidoreductase [Verrucomicrobia bacterium]|nr:TAT-variant-translocated molybdopterin oxidoreductase [Verrucomicrobiota bacterium]
MERHERKQRSNDAGSSSFASGANPVPGVDGVPGDRGVTQWGSLEQLTDSPEFKRWSGREFPDGASELADPLERRQFLKLMGASLALMGVTGCYRPPEEKIVPYLEQPEFLISGRPLYFATAMPFNGSATGLLVTSNEGRPTKIEGNSGHSLSLGATSVFEQAALLTLYDPDRSKTITHNGQIETWEQLIAAWLTEQDQQLAQQGRTLRFLIDSTTSPTAAWQISELQKRFPSAKWYHWEPISHESIVEAHRSLFGRPAYPEFQFADADVIVSFDNDFLFDSPYRLAYSRAFARRRSYQTGDFSNPNRLYLAEPSPTITGSMADERLPIDGSVMGTLVQMLAASLGVSQAKAEVHEREAVAWVEACTRQLKQTRGRSLVTAGYRQPAEVHRWVHAINAALGNIGKTVNYREVPNAAPLPPFKGLAELAQDLGSGQVETLIIIGGNPVFDAPADLEFEKKLTRARFTLHLSLFQDETSTACQWHVPENHFLESWSDAVGSDGSTSIVQPLIAPLYSGYSRHQLFALFLGQVSAQDYDLVRDYWRAHAQWNDFEKQWRQVLSDGFLPVNSAAVIPAEDSASPPQPITSGQPTPEREGSLPVRQSLPQSAFSRTTVAASGPRDPSNTIELSFHPDPTIWDGRFANNGWAQELPKPFTRITWDNPALISPALAKELQVANGDIVEIRTNAGKVEIPVWIFPGQAKRTISLYLGGGRYRCGNLGNNVGVNVYPLRTTQQPWVVSETQVRKLGKFHQIVSTQFHHSMQGREPVQTRTLDEFVRQVVPPDQLTKKPEPDQTLYNFEERLTAEHQWGMVINLNTCIGCNACVLACQSENNIPVVGQDQVWRGRIMHWIRIDRYFEGEPDAPKFYQQPVPCMHCETAPCELVCPVEATNHSAEGLNQMIYNRCIGTRFCSNNCPYKVRRFNFLQFADTKTLSFQLGWNPEVTVRARGVMEKCSYCVQRIRAVEFDADKANRKINDGEIVPACAQVCPAEAITFGDLKQQGSQVSQLKTSRLNYGLLEELNTRPRTTYLAKVVTEKPETKLQAKE